MISTLIKWTLEQKYNTEKQNKPSIKTTSKGQKWILGKKKCHFEEEEGKITNLTEKKERRNRIRGMADEKNVLDKKDNKNNNKKTLKWCFTSCFGNDFERKRMILF